MKTELMERALGRARRAAALLGGLCLGLACSLFLVWDRGAAGGLSNVDQAMLDPEVREAAIERLLDLTAGFYDSFPDADVGRVLRPKVDTEQGEIRLLSNRLGMREREYLLPKPDTLTRIVLLGDSFVMGMGVNAEDRLGVHLERAIRERAGLSESELEVLHIGLGSWNIRAECAFLRRQLSLLQPDLVVHVVMDNDLDDCSAVRGFGALSKFSSQQRGRATGLIQQAYPRQLGFGGSNWLAAGLDHESRQRYEEAGQDISRLRDVLGIMGCKYVLLLRFGDRQAPAETYLGAGLPPESKLYLPRSFDIDERYRLAPRDAHWSPAGHRRMAELLYGCLQKRELLPALSLRPWPEAQATFEELNVQGREAATQPFPLQEFLARTPISNSLDFRRLNRARAAQVHGGIHADGTLSPYASLILKQGQGRELFLQGEVFDRAELREGTVSVFVEEYSVGTIALADAGPVERRLPLPEAVRTRPFVNVRLVASDFAYQGDNLRRCASMRLAYISVE